MSLPVKYQGGYFLLSTSTFIKPESHSQTSVTSKFLKPPEKKSWKFPLKILCAKSKKTFWNLWKNLCFRHKKKRCWSLHPKMAQGEKEFGLASKGQRQHLHQVSLLHDLPGDLEPKNQSPPLVVWVGPLRKGGLGRPSTWGKKAFQTVFRTCSFSGRVRFPSINIAHRDWGWCSGSGWGWCSGLRWCWRWGLG